MVNAAYAAYLASCGGIVNEFQSITNPMWFSSFYFNNLDCTWHIELGDISGFTIVNNFFDMEYESGCGWDYLKLIDGNGYEQNFCGELREGVFFDSYSNYEEEQQLEDEKDERNPTTQLVNVSNDGFPDRMFIAGGSATIRFVTDSSLRHGGFHFNIEKPSRFDIEKLSRFEIIEYFAKQVIDSVADEGWGNRFSGRMQKILSRLRDADTGVSCYEQNFRGESADEEDQITVFDADNMCKLNGQVNAAINSYARNNACDGRGKVYRQIIRSARKIKKFFNDKNMC